MSPKDNQKRETNPEPDPEQSYNNRRLEDWLKLALWIVGVVAVGMLAINQALGFFYKAEFLKTPCELCSKLNPGVQNCIDDLNSPRASYYNGSGGWTDPFPEDNINIIIP